MFTTKVYANMLAIQNAERLDAERLRRIVECKTVAEAFKVLGDYGYVYSEGVSVDGFIVGETNRLIEFITDNSPSAGLVGALTARFVYNNAKLAYKSRFSATPDDGYYQTPLDIKSVTDGDYSELDVHMAQALEMLDENDERQPQKIDLALTRAMYKQVLGCGIATVKKYFTAEIDMKNILTAARMRRLNMHADEFVDGGRVNKELLDESISADSFAACYERTPYAEYAERIEDGAFTDLWRAELESDDHLYFLTDSEVKAFGSYKPLLNYYTQSLIELKTVKTALVCIKTNSRDMFYKRIPKIYQ